MAPLPANNTPRMWIKYTSVGQQHEAQIRLAPGSDSADATDVYNVLAPLMAVFLPTSDAVLGFRYSAQGSTLSFPIVTTTTPGTWSGTPDDDEIANFLSFSGRSVSGRRNRFTLFTPAADAAVNGYRELVPAAAIQDLLDALTELSIIKGIDGQTMAWNGYVNLGYNAYFQRKARRVSAS